MSRVSSVVRSDDEPATQTVAEVHRGFACIDGLRAIAALLVFLYHGSILLGMGGFMTRHWDVIGLFGPMGVCIFFVISGFLLYRPFLVTLIGGERFPSFSAFWARRFARILPAYWLALAVVTLVTSQIEIPSVGDGLTFFGLVQNYRTDYVNRGMDVAWTLVIEMSFYLVIPVFAWLMAFATRRAQSRRVLFWVNLAGVGAWFAGGTAVRIWDIWFRQGPRAAAAGWFDVQETTRWLPGYLHWFAGGMALAFIVEWSRRGGRMSRAIELLGRYPACSWALAGAFLAVDIAVDIPANVYQGTAVQGFLLTMFTPLFAVFLVLPAVIGHRRSAIRTALASPVMAWLGLVSYGIYLWHRPVMKEVLARTSGGGARTGLLWIALRYGIVTVVTLAIAAASFYLLEQPVIRLARRFRSARPTRPGPAHAART